MRMARANVYLPDELAEAARASGLNVSNLTQEAIRRELRRLGIKEWIEDVCRLVSPHLDHATVTEAVDAAREEFGSLRG